MNDLSVLLLAAGASTRFGAPKLLQMLEGQSVLRRSLEAFAVRSDVRRIVIVGQRLNDDALALVERQPDRIRVVPGGANRAESLRCGLDALDESTEWVAVHDAARPLVSQALIDRVVGAARQTGAAGPALPVALTIKQARGPLPASVERTIPRHDLFAMQTPQIARRSALLEAMKCCPIPLDQVTDDLQLLELTGQPATLVEGDAENLKITTPLDLNLARLILSERAERSR